MKRKEASVLNVVTNWLSFLVLVVLMLFPSLVGVYSTFDKSN